MRIPVALLVLAAALAPAAAQPPAAPAGLTLDAMRRNFPLDHQAIQATLAGKTPEEARRLAYAGIDRFLRSRRSAILAAPGPSLVAIEVRQGAMLRALGNQDVRLCASVGDRGFFSSEAAAGAPPPGLDAYGVALIEAAKAGAGSARAAPLATAEDFQAWLAAVRKIEPGVAVWEMLTDRELRARSTPDHLCRGAAAMHEAVGALPAEAGERVARTLLGSVIGSAAP
ncbi:MAG TPA: hypothetical protein VD846_14475 [Allosphingosinicella sp.]|nr:hypothetical protein [Allosphingosinicella sp.]